jgi:serine/threonine protein kinase
VRDFPFSLNGGRYHVERVFADSGGMGVLFQARDRRLADNLVLLKTTRYDGGRHARHFRYTKTEAIKHVIQTRKIIDWEKKVLIRFREAGVNNIPGVNDYFFGPSQTLAASYDGKPERFSLPDKLLAAEPYLVMEYVQGEPLEDRMRKQDFRAQLELRLLQMAREVLTIFARLHAPTQLGAHTGCFIYQDLKPANILVSHDDYFTLIDFGAVTLKLGPRTTEPTAGCITTGYAAPEASDGRESLIDPRFDLYTLGATFWHAVTLQDPRDMSGEFPELSPHALRSAGMSDAFCRIAAKALARDPRERYQTADEMKADVLAQLRVLLT